MHARKWRLSRSLKGIYPVLYLIKKASDKSEAYDLFFTK